MQMGPRCKTPCQMKLGMVYAGTTGSQPRQCKWTTPGLTRCKPPYQMKLGMVYAGVSPGNANGTTLQNPLPDEARHGLCKDNGESAPAMQMGPRCKTPYQMKLGMVYAKTMILDLQNTKPFNSFARQCEDNRTSPSNANGTTPGHTHFTRWSQHGLCKDNWESSPSMQMGPRLDLHCSTTDTRCNLSLNFQGCM